MRAVAACVVFLMSVVCAYAQHSVNFSIQSTACKNEILAVNNTSDTGGNLEWNFCATELNGTYASLAFGNITTFLTSLELVEDNGTWYGFGTSRNNELVRMDFGSFALNPSYTLTSLHNPGNLLASPDGISIVKDGNAWYGLVTNLDAGEIIRLKWTSLTAAPEATSLNLAATGKFSHPSQVEIKKDNNEFIALVADGGLNKVVAINFHASMTTSPTATDIVQMDFPGASNMYGVSATRQCDSWEIYTIADNAIYRLKVPTLTTTTATPQEFSSSFSFPIGQFNRIRTMKYYDKTYMYFTSFTGNYLAGASWKVGASTPQQVNIGSITVPASPFSLALFKEGDTYGMFVGGFNAGTVRGIQLTSTCSANRRNGTEFHPIDVSYSAAGNNSVGLNITYPDGQVCSASQDIVVSTNDAPAFDFSFDNICKNSTTSFSIAASQAMPSTWDYGDGTMNSIASHSYTSAGMYEVVAVVTAANSCKNRKYKNITIYDPPVAAFDVPTGQVCTNNVFTFVDTTPGDFDGQLSYKWEVDNVQISTDENLRFAFTSTSDHSIKFTTSIPGCSSNVSHTVTGLLPGPNVGFTSNGNCASQDVSFTNSSSGDISGYSWDFGDGQTSTATSTTHVFATTGNFVVALNANAPNGCVSTTTQNLRIYSLPEPTFSIDLPPFSCSGTPSQFHDTTPSMTDSNIQTWTWLFGDSGSGAGKDPTHTYTNAGPYTARLSVTTDRGCSNFADQQVNITQSPIASFTSDPACANQTTHFTDASTGGVALWQWKVNTSSYATKDPTHTFSMPGSYNVQLTVTGANNCTASITKQVVVPVVPTIDFTVTNPCSGQVAEFTDVTNNPTDPISQQSWTFNNSGTATGQPGSYVFSNTGSFPVQLVVQGQSGCSYSITKQVTIHQSPLAAFTMSDQSGPPPLHVVFTNTSTGATSYVWELGDGSSPSMSASTDHTYASLGDYNVKLSATSAEGCSDTKTAIVSVITPVDELAIEDFLLKQSVNSSYQGYVQVRNNGNYRIQSFVVNYDVGGGIRLTEVVPADLSIGDVKTFTLSTTFTDPAKVAFVCAVLNDDSNDNNNKACATLSDDAIIFNASPNPATTYIDIESIHADTGEVHVRLFSMTGGLAYDKTLAVDKGLSQLSLDIQDLAPGIYVVVISSGDSTLSQKVLISR